MGSRAEGRLSSPLPQYLALGSCTPAGDADVRHRWPRSELQSDGNPKIDAPPDESHSHSAPLLGLRVSDLPPQSSVLGEQHGGMGYKGEVFGDSGPLPSQDTQGIGNTLCHGLTSGRVRGQSQSSSPIWQIRFFEPAELPNVSHNSTALLSVFTSFVLRTPHGSSWKDVLVSQGGMPSETDRRWRRVGSSQAGSSWWLRTAAAAPRVTD